MSRRFSPADKGAVKDSCDVDGEELELDRDHGEVEPLEQGPVRELRPEGRPQVRPELVGDALDPLSLRGLHEREEPGDFDRGEQEAVCEDLEGEVLAAPWYHGEAGIVVQT